MSKKNLELYASTVLNEMVAGVTTISAENKKDGEGSSSSPAEQLTTGLGGINNFSKLMN
jgi:hypothetical protein